MDLILKEFHSDLDRVRNLIELIDCLTAFTATSNTNTPAQKDNFIEQAEEVNKRSKECYSQLRVLPGTLILYMGGRFEYFVRTAFEDLSDRVADKCKSFKKLPKRMQESLISLTAEVMQKQRKYGHGELDVIAIVGNLASNLRDEELPGRVNTHCLSITSENMRPDVLQDLFGRIGANGIWEKVGQQARLMNYLEIADAVSAAKNARSQLDAFMDLRNKIAHPSEEVEWPDSSKVKKYADFLKVLSEAIWEVAGNFEFRLTATGE